MVKNIKYGFILLAFGITLLHSVVPHKHHDQMILSEDSNSHQEAETIFDLMALLFHPDEGDSNIENIQQCTTTHAIPQLSATLLHVYFELPTPEKISIKTNTNFLPVIYSSPSLDVIAQRGPPTHSIC